MVPDTLAGIVNRVTTRFPRADADFNAIISSDMIKWLSTLSTYFPYWFLTISPGQGIPDLTAPVTLSTLPTRGPAGSRWVDMGWLVTQPNVSTYDIYHPLSTELALDSPGTASLWQPCKVQRVDYVLEFDTNLSFLQDLPCPEHGEAFGFQSFRTKERPCQVIWRKLETKSQLIFQPTPDDYYLYAIQFVIAEPPLYQVDGGDTFNRWFTFAPEAVELYALIKAAEYYGEPQKAQEYMMQLYGNPPTGDCHARMQFVGELGRLKKETVAKQHRLQEQMQWFMSRQTAFGRGNGAMYPSPLSTLRWNSPYYRTSLYGRFGP